MKQLNINDDIFVQITKKGMLHLKNTQGEQYITNSIVPYSALIHGEIWWKLQFHQVANLFGGILYNGSDLPISTTILLPNEDNEEDCDKNSGYFDESDKLGGE